MWKRGLASTTEEGLAVLFHRQTLCSLLIITPFHPGLDGIFQGGVVSSKGVVRRGSVRGTLEIP